MNAPHVPFAHVRAALAGAGFGGVPVPPGGFGAVYALAASGPGAQDAYGPSDWAVLSYVRTNAPSGVGGMPEYVANEVEDVLDSLIETKILAHRALYFDAAGTGRPGFTAAGVLHCLNAPVICVPPTRISEYARYQIPDKWDERTYSSFIILEEVLRNCPACNRFCPSEFDSRLINVAAALRAWPVMEAMLGSTGRGAFISFESFDRFSHTIEWYQVLLHLALESCEYSAQLVDKSIELYGQPLFRPCLRCVQSAKEMLMRSFVQPNLQMLEDTISSLVMQASRFTLAHGDSRLTSYVWTLPGLPRINAQGALWGYASNEERLALLSRRMSPPRRELLQIGAKFLRDRPGEASCFRHADKWTTAAILNNIPDVVRAFSAPSSVGALCKRAYREAMRRILQRGAITFGSAIEPGYPVDRHPEMRKCRRSPRCTGKRMLCLFNEHSGIVPPASVPRFLRDCELSPADAARVAKESIAALQARIETARICFAAGWAPAEPSEGDMCCACHPQRRSYRETRRLVLLGWNPTPSFLPLPGLRLPVIVPPHGPLSGHSAHMQRHQPQQSQQMANPVQHAHAGQQGAPVQNLSPAPMPPSAHSASQGQNIQAPATVAQNTSNAQNASLVQNASPMSNAPHAQSPVPIQNTVSVVDILQAAGQMLPDGASGAQTNPETESESSTRSLPVPPIALGRGHRQLPSDVLAFVVVDAQKMEHVVASGVNNLLRASPLMQCIICATRYVCLNIEAADDVLEVHLDNELQPRHAARRLYNGVMAAHDLFAAA